MTAAMSDQTLTWIDTHVHWDAPEFDLDRDAALQRARAAGVVCCINPSVTAAGIDAVRALAMVSAERPDWPCILPAFGIHPLYVIESHRQDLDLLERMLREARPVAVGEIGLDRYAGAPDFKSQCTLFEAQLHLAATYALPVVLHVRYAVEEVIQRLKRVQGTAQRIPGGIAHAFNGSREQAEQLIRMGFVLGFGGSCTYEGSSRIRSLLQTLPLSALVLETDAPDMSPAWGHGQRNESSQLVRIAETVAMLREMPLAELSSATRQNVARIFVTDQDGAHTQSVGL